MLAASIRGIQDTEIPKAGMSQIPRTEGWEAAKAASTRGIQDKEIPKAGMSQIPGTGGWHCLKHQSVVYKTKIPKAGMSQIPRTESWKAAFLVGSRSGAVGKVNNKVISKAQLA